MKQRVYWKPDELKVLHGQWLENRKRGMRAEEALIAAQKATLPPSRQRHINSNALHLVRAYGDSLPPAPPAVEEVKQEAPAAEPAPAPAAPEPPPLRALFTELLVEAGRILIADQTFQEIALHVARKFLTEVLRQPEQLAAPRLAPEVERTRKPRVVVVGMLNGQQQMIQSEYGDAIRLNFVPKDHRGEQLRDAAQGADAAYVMKFAGHAEWNKINAWVGEDVEVGFMTGLDKLRRALDKFKNART
jgi:hypothetical protein